MRLRIHRGAATIGGNCVEVEAGGQSLLLDLGLPLDADGPAESLLPPTPGLVDGANPDLLGAVLSHPHADHFGLLAAAHPSIPVFLGEAASRLLAAAAPFTGNSGIRQPVTTYRHRQPFTLGPFRITPYLMDHSAFDAHALLVEADGKRLLYSGDFRGHGRKAKVFEGFLAAPPANVDVLLLEGTVLGRKEDDAPVTETQLEDRLQAAIRSTPGLVLTCFSPQNVDRFVTVYKAARRAGRTLIIDVYTASLLDALGLSSLPGPSSPGLRIYLPLAQKRRIVRSARFDLVERCRARRIFARSVAANPGRWVTMFRSSMIEDAANFGALAGGRLIWSMWPGYLERSGSDLRQWAADQGLAFEVQHTSGHAHAVDLARMVEAVAPRQVVPIHTTHPGEFSRLFAKVRGCRDGEWVEVT